MAKEEPMTQPQRRDNELQIVPVPRAYSAALSELQTSLVEVKMANIALAVENEQLKREIAVLRSG
jgi:regulator of replication initiation timing